MMNMVNDNMCDWSQSVRKCLLIFLALMFLRLHRGNKVIYSVLIFTELSKTKTQVKGKILAHLLVF